MRASIHWLSGVLDGISGYAMAANFKLGIAQEDYAALGMQAERAACAADQTRWPADPNLPKAPLVRLQKAARKVPARPPPMMNIFLALDKPNQLHA